MELENQAKAADLSEIPKERSRGVPRSTEARLAGLEAGAIRALAKVFLESVV